MRNVFPSQGQRRFDGTHRNWAIRKAQDSNGGTGKSLSPACDHFKMVNRSSTLFYQKLTNTRRS